MGSVEAEDGGYYDVSPSVRVKPANAMPRARAACGSRRLLKLAASACARSAAYTQALSSREATWHNLAHGHRVCFRAKSSWRRVEVNGPGTAS